MRATLLAVLFIFCLSGKSLQSKGNEYNIKSMFVLNFIKYIQWPVENTSNYFRIGVIGKSEMYKALKSMTANRNETKQIKIEEISNQSVEGFKMIVISKSENYRAEELLKKYRGKGVLIITDEYKGKNTAAINLVNINNKIRFEINPNSAQADGIRVSSKLIDLSLSNK